MSAKTDLLAKLLRINQLETRLKALRADVKEAAPIAAQEIIDKYGEGTLNVLGFQVEVKIKKGRASLAWRKYLDWLKPNLKPSHRAKEKEFMNEGESKPDIAVVKRLK